MNSLARKYKTEWLEDQVSQLQLRIIELEAEARTLKARIAILEKDNRHLWKRVLNYQTLAEERAALAEVDESMRVLQEQAALTTS